MSTRHECIHVIWMWTRNIQHFTYSCNCNTIIMCISYFSIFFPLLFAVACICLFFFFSGCSFASLSSVLAVCCVLEAISSFHMEWLLSVHCAHIFRFVKQIEWMRFFFFFFFSLSALVCDCIWDAIELHCSVYTVQYLHFYLECKQKDAVTKLK